MRRAAVLACLVLVPVGARAQEAVIAVDNDAPAERRTRWVERVEGAIDPVSLDAVARSGAPAGTVGAERLGTIREVETLLMQARASRARLREGEALRALARAETLIERSLDVPGIGAWYAEVQLAIAITAAQAGQTGLSEAALHRAASVDPSRIVQAAEARPEVVRLARAIRRLRATAPRGRFEVTSDVEGAVVWVDDEVLGALPRTVEAPVGPHLLRIDAPGHGSWATILDVREGNRPPLDVRLSPLQALRQARRAADAASEGDREALVAALGGWDHAPRVRLVWPGTGARDRALSQACGGSRCGSLQQLDAADWPVPLVFEGPAGPALASGEAWLREPIGVIAPPDLQWFERWELWVAVGSVLLVGAAIAVGAGVDYAQRSPEHVITVIDEFTDP